jgi:hypothetical protein
MNGDRWAIARRQIGKYFRTRESDFTSLIDKFCELSVLCHDVPTTCLALSSDMLHEGVFGLEAVELDHLSKQDKLS